MPFIIAFLFHLVSTARIASIPLKDTNVAGIGTDADKALRKQAASSEAAWEGVGTEPGLAVWRIEQFQVVPVERSSYGEFHKGDSYIVLNTVMNEDSDKLIRTIYFYLGTETSQDEQGTAAYKTVELDDFFDGEPTQVRVEMGNEPKEFLELFGGSVSHLEGGVESGFKHFKPAGHETRLFVVRRVKHRTKVVQAPLAKHVINDNDSFVLDAKDRIYVYNGPGSSNFEKYRANEKAMLIRDQERGGTVKVTHDIDMEQLLELLGI